MLLLTPIANAGGSRLVSRGVDARHARRDSTTSAAIAATSIITAAQVILAATATSMPARSTSRTLRIPAASSQRVSDDGRTGTLNVVSGTWRGDAVDDLRQQVVRTAAFEQGIRCQGHAMAQSRQGNSFHIVRRHVIASIHQRHCARAANEREGSA